VAVDAARAATERRDHEGYVSALRLRANALARLEQFDAAEAELVDADEYALANLREQIVDVKLHRLQMRRFVQGLKASDLAEFRNGLFRAYADCDRAGLAARPATFWSVAIELGASNNPSWPTPSLRRNSATIRFRTIK